MSLTYLWESRLKAIGILIVFCFAISFASVAQQPAAVAMDQPGTNSHSSVLIVPYMPSMHLSDSDPHIAEGSEKNIGEVREDLRAGLLRCLNKKFEEVYDVKMPVQDFVKGDQRDLAVIYHSLAFFQDSTYPAKYPVKDTTRTHHKVSGKNSSKANQVVKNYINVFPRDPQLIPDFAKKYDCDYIIFLNELDINTYADDCINLAMMIYQRDLRVHYSVFDRTGKQVYGDLAVSFFPSNSNDVDEIVEKNFPAISDYILQSMKRVRN